jgi:hypothetical protein
MDLTPGMLYMAHHDDFAYAYYVTRMGMSPRRYSKYRLWAIHLDIKEDRLVAEWLTKTEAIGYLKLLNVLNGRETWHT